MNINQKNHSKNKVTKAFTLVEMLVVIVVISILMTLGMQFWWWQIGKLSEKVATEYITDTFHRTYRNTTTSSYHNWDHFEHVKVDFTVGSWDFGVYYKYDDKDKREQEIVYDNTKPEFLISKINDGELQSVTVKMLPNQLGCEVYDKDNEFISDLVLQFDIQVSKYCFQLDQDVCRLKKTDCTD